MRLPSRTPPLPLLITGITGVAGFRALHYFQRRFPGQVIGIRPRQTVRLNGEGIVPLDAEDRAGLCDLFRTYHFRAVLNAAGNCALKACQLDPAMARVLNVASAEAIVDCARINRARLVHLSTDLVFSGQGDGNLVETDPVDPVTVYGQTMAEAETLIQQTYPEALILRVSLPMGPSFNRHAGAIDWILSRFRHGRPATLYFDEVRTPAYADDLSRLCRRLLAGSESGLFHAGGSRALSLYQIGQIINRVGGYAPELLKGCPRLEAGPVPPRAGNVSLNSDRLLKTLGWSPLRPWPVDADLLPNDPDWHRRRPIGESGSLQRIAEQLYHARVDLSKDFPNPAWYTGVSFPPFGKGSPDKGPPRGPGEEPILP
jgi:dTDP-4-dehydrorhamnose reductase